MKISALLFFSSLVLFAAAQDAAPVTQADVDSSKATMNDLCTGDTWTAMINKLQAQYKELTGDDPWAGLDDTGGADDDQGTLSGAGIAAFNDWVKQSAVYRTAVAECEQAKLTFHAKQDALAAQNKPQDDKPTTESDLPAPETTEATTTPTKPTQTDPEKPQGAPTTYTTSQADAPAQPSQSDPSSASSVEMAGNLLLSTMALAVWVSVG